MSNIGPIAMFVLAVLLLRQPLLLDRHPGQDRHLPQGDQGEPAVHPRLPQGHAPAGDCGAGQRMPGQPAGAGLRGCLRDLQAADGRLGTAAQSGPAGALRPDRGQRGCDQPGAAHDVAGDDCVRHARSWACSAPSWAWWTHFTDWARPARPRCGPWRRASAEALITTAAGLFVAVPAVVAYNQFTARIRVFASAMDDFCRELLNSLEEIPVRAAAPAPPRGPDDAGTGGGTWRLQVAAGRRGVRWRRSTSRRWWTWCWCCW